jgi:hypothetical protein
MTSPDMDWVYAEDIRRILDMLPGVQTDPHSHAGAGATIDFPSALDLELGWDQDNWASSASGIGVF